jgi:mono/diheme cytochrome c family protein
MGVGLRVIGMGLAVPVVLGLGLAAPAAEDRDAGGKAATYKEHVVPLLTKYCTYCHGGKKPRAGLDLEKYRDESAVAKDPKVWGQVLDYLESEEMPPPSRPQPSAKEAELLKRWIEARLSPGCDGPADPGRVTLRRLNRAEYNNTIRDLVGVDFHPADDFPSDDVGYGFDNIGDVLTLPPILMEKYLAAAEEIAEAAIVANERLDPLKRHIEAERVRGPDGFGEPYKGFARILASEGAIRSDFQPSREGEFVVRIRAFGQQAGPEPVKMAFKVNGDVVATFDVTATEDAPATYETRIPLKRGQKRIAVAFTNDYHQPDDPDPKKRGDRNLIVDWIEIEGPFDGGKSLPEPHRRIVVRTPKTKDRDEWRECAREVLERFASRAYRRPATAEEVARLVRFVEMAHEDGERYERGIQLAVEATLASPHFLFRVEVDREPGKPHPITDFELASRLSYFLWSSMPDDELFRLARENKLHEPGVLDAQVARMLKDGKARGLVENFAGQWLQVRNLRNVAPDPKQFPSFDEDLRAAMLRETELFFEAVAREDRSILDFLDADFTFLNERLARHYGIEGVKGPEFRRVSLKDDRRGGLLTQASILTITSNPTRTSPVKRGKWILEQVLGTPPPPPPPDVPELSEAKEAVLSGTLRQRMEQHRANPNCASCHGRMDPLGFGFENYDAIGAWRDKDESFPIDPSGTLPSGQSFRGPKELKAILKAKDKDFARCLAEKMLTYALGRGLEFADRCTVDGIVAGLAADGYRFSSLVRGIVKSEPFLKRNAKGDES